MERTEETYPSRQIAPQTQTGIIARDMTIERLASTYMASASRRNLPSRSSFLIGERTTSEALKSNSESGSERVDSGVSEGMLEGRSSAVVGAMEP